MNEIYCKESRVEALKGRSRRCCCKYCGRQLRLKRIMFSDYEDARIEIYCEHCERIEYGAEPEIYLSARRFVDQLDFNYYPDLDNNQKTRRMNIAKVCEMMAWGYQDLGLIDQNGFTVALPEQGHCWEESIVLCEEDIPREE